MNGALQLFALVVASGLVGAGIAFVVMRAREKPKASGLPLDERPDTGSVADQNVRMACWQGSARMDLPHEENLKRARTLYDFIAANEIRLPHCMEEEPGSTPGSNVTPFTPRPVA